MELTVIGSNSEGNAYVLQNAGEALLLEAGKPFKQVLEALGGNVRKVVGCLVTHEHGDHAGRIDEVLSYAIPVFASEGTIEGAGKYMKGNYAPIPIKAEAGSYGRLQLGGFVVIPFQTKRDAAEPLGFYIWHEETGGILFATDTYYLPCTFKGLSNILIECNYDPDILAKRVENGDIPEVLQERVRRSHLSYYTCLDTLRANDLTAVNNIVLIHISDGNGNAMAFRNGIAKATGKTVHIAKPGLKIKFNKTPF
jgi:phosphoribosyl 1,2-cyclic phosphodiesterase